MAVLKSPPRRWSVVGAVVLAATLALSGCAGGSGASSTTLTIAINGEPQSLDPAKNGGDYQQIVQWLSYEPLIRQNADGTFSPGLAESWEYVGDDNTTFEMNLRPDATFADGTPVTAEAVVDTIEYYVATPGTLHSVIDALTDVEAVDDDTVRVVYSQPNPILPYVFSQMTSYGNVISPAGLADPEKLGSATFGAGPYILDSAGTVTGDRYTFTKNDAYWNPDAQHYEKVVVRVIGDAQTALSALRTGQINVSTVTTQSQLTEAQAASVDILTGKPLSIVVWLIDRDGQINPAMGDVRVRQALNYAIDREAIAKALGEAYTPLNQYVPPGLIGFSDALDDAYAYDPARAKQLLADAGFSGGFTLNFATNTDNRDAEVSQILVEQWNAIGVTANLTTYNNQPGEMFGAIGDGQVAALTFALNADVTTQQSLLTAQSVFNPSGLTSPEVDAAYAALAVAPEAEVASAAEAVSAAISADAWFAPVVSVDSYVFAKGVADLGPLAANGALDLLDWKPAS
ncbi:ABC transporter substrate-binding protein [Microbacterium sp. RG1]|uniref:ABC transporter substrate-binding protein n=1 Tax=Microbacterium sp. RG1 TaxID=2489212 RepID=UPI0010CA4C30|nr:ABC transporter substrate-binding protein [Microbacterium sp. RG1]QCQ17592.1 hypothetical protein EHF32_13130 [Microbacterium sp. RG1]